MRWPAPTWSCSPCRPAPSVEWWPRTAPRWAGKVVIDAVNRIGESEVNSRAIVAAAAPDARYVRAFNTLGWENFADPPPGAALFFAADPGARPAAEELIAAVGLEPVCAGPADVSGTVDALLPLWFALVKHNGGNRRVALSIVS
jgi:predicted dinucleotide-binding enzyme